MNTIKQQTTSELALQKAEDNKKEITYIYSKLKDLHVEVESLKVGNDNTNNNNSSQYECQLLNGLPSTYFTYVNKDWSYICNADDNVAIANIIIYSPIQQSVSITGYLKYYNSIATAKEFTANWFMNNALIYTYDYTTSGGLASTSFTAHDVLLEKGYNTLSARFAHTFEDTMTYQYFHNLTININGYGITLMEENQFQLNLCYCGETSYYMNRTNNQGFQVVPFDNIPEYIAHKTDYIFKPDTTVYSNYTLTNVIIYNTETGQNEFYAYPAFSFVLPSRTFAVYNTGTGKEYSGYTPGKTGVITPTTDPNLTLKEFVINNNNKCYIVKFSDFYIMQTITGITKKISAKFNIEDINKVDSVRIIDSLFLDNRDLTLIFRMKNNDYYLVYNIESEEISTLYLGNGGNVTAYFYENNIFFFMNKNGKMFVNYIKYENGTYLLLDNETLIGYHKHFFALNYNNWYYLASDRCLKRINNLPYRFE